MRKKNPSSKSSGGMNIGPLLTAIVISGLRLSIDNKKYVLSGPVNIAKKAQKPVKPSTKRTTITKPIRPTNRKRGTKMKGGGQAEFFE